jgi:hypothetical protein
MAMRVAVTDVSYPPLIGLESPAPMADVLAVRRQSTAFERRRGKAHTRRERQR